MPLFLSCASLTGLKRLAWRTFLTVFLLSLSGGTARSQTPNLTDAQKFFDSGEFAACRDMAAEAIKQGTYNRKWWPLKIRAEMASGEYLAAWETFLDGRSKDEYDIGILWAGRDVCRYVGSIQEVRELEQAFDAAVENAAWRYTDSHELSLRALREFEKGNDAKKVLEEHLDRATRQSSRSVEAWTVIGNLGLTKHDYALAADGFRKAIEARPENPDAHFGLAKALSSSNSELAQASLEKALELNPAHIDSLLHMAENQVDAEAYDQARETLDQVLEVNPEHPLAWAYLAVIAHVEADSDQEEFYRRLALGWWKNNPEVDHLIGRKLSDKYRFAEGAAYQRRAIEMAPGHLGARFQLAQDLLRLGLEEQGWQLAEQVFADDPYNVVAHNLLTLRDNLNQYATLRSEHFILRMESAEVPAYGQRAITLLEEAYDHLTARYPVKIDRPVVVEIFARQEDFAIRTFGLPGGAGFLGVCFGPVITANSPAAQAVPSSWESVLWHEFCHVVTLTKTRNKMPRWLSEGISVYEERLKDPAWGQQLNPTFRQMLLEELTPVSQLSGAFLQPDSAMHLQFAYFESSLVVEYLVDQFGLEALNQVLDDLGSGIAINDALSRRTVPINRLDQMFADYAEKKANSLSPEMDWTESPVGPRESLTALVEARSDHPNHYQLLRVLSARLLQAGRLKEAEEVLKQRLKLLPGDTEAFNLLARVYREQEDESSLRDTLQQWTVVESDAIDGLMELARLQLKAGDFPEALKTAERWIAVQPLLAEPHRVAATSAMQLDRPKRAIEAYQVLSQIDDSDPAETHFQLGRLLMQQGNLEAAKRELLRAAAEAPRYRAALRELLQVNRSLQAARQPDTVDPEAPPNPRMIAPANEPKQPEVN